MNAKAVYVKTTDAIGLIIDQDPARAWYRTDADGIREPHELEFLTSLQQVRERLKKGAFIAPSTYKAIFFNNK